jgi:hypothetical protein
VAPWTTIVTGRAMRQPSGVPGGSTCANRPTKNRNAFGLVRLQTRPSTKPLRAPWTTGSAEACVGGGAGAEGAEAEVGEVGGAGELEGAHRGGGQGGEAERDGGDLHGEAEGRCRRRCRSAAGGGAEAVAEDEEKIGAGAEKPEREDAEQSGEVGEHAGG